MDFTLRDWPALQVRRVERYRDHQMEKSLRASFLFNAQVQGMRRKGLVTVLRYAVCIQLNIPCSINTKFIMGSPMFFIWTSGVGVKGMKNL